jgi:hypothetical protein
MRSIPRELRFTVHGAHIPAAVGQDVDAPVQKRESEGGVVVGVGPQRVAVVTGLGREPEVHAEHRARAARDERDAPRGRGLFDPRPHRPPVGVHPLERTGLGERADRRGARGEVHRVAVIGAGVDRAAVVEHVEDLLAAADRRKREPRRHRLGVDGKIGNEPEVLTSATEREPEAGDHLVEDRHRPVPATAVDDARQESRLGLAGAAIGQQRLGEHRRDLPRMLGERPLERGEIIPWHDDRVGEFVGWLAATGGQGLDRIGRLRPVAHEHVVEPAMVVPLELHEERPAREGPREPQRRLHRLGAGVRKDHPLEPRHHARHQFGQLDLAAVLGAESEAAGELVGDRRDHGRVCVAEDKRPPGERVVEQSVAVGVEIPGSLAPLEEERRRRTRLAHPARHAHRERLLRSFEQLRGGIDREWRGRGGGHAKRAPDGMAIGGGQRPGRLSTFQHTKL